MRAVIICGGIVTDYSSVKAQIKDDDVIICADSGYDHAIKLGLKADIVVGDFDSISGVPTDVETVRYPSRKNQTDSEIALDHARSMGFKDFLLIAATGTRLDHTLTNIMLLKSCLDRGESAAVIDAHNKIIMTDSAVHLHEPTGSIVSLVPLTDCAGVSTENLEYPLSRAALYVGKSLGVSNIMSQSDAHISVESGVLLVIIAKD